MPAVSVIMNCYNGREYLREALDSIYAQTFDDWEIIFWDNASTDDSAYIAQCYDQRLCYFRSEAIVPLGMARNAALAEVTGTFIAFLDTDDMWMPEKLERQLELFAGRPRLGLVHADVSCLYQTDGSRIGHFASLGHKPKRGKIFDYLLRENAIAMPSVMLRTEALRAQSEWFDTRFEIYPDFDLFRRIAHDWECDYVDEQLATYRIHAKSSSTRNHLRAAEELSLSIEKFRRIFPSIDSDYPAQMRYLDAMVAYQRGKSLWRDGYGHQARIEFFRHWRTPKNALAYLASWFPYAGVERLWMRLNRMRSRD